MITKSKQSEIIWLLLALLACPVVANAQWKYATNYDNTITITGYNGSDGNEAMTNRIDGLPVACIGNHAFESLHLTRVTIPDSVTRIGERAFSDCTRLTAVILPDSIASIGRSAFQNCTLLTSLTIPGKLTRIENYTFYGCTRLTNNLAIPSHVTYIGDFAFASCSSLTSLTIPGSVAHLGDYAFYVCSNLTNICFRGNAPSLGDKVFCNDNKAVICHLPDTTGWSPYFGGRPTAIWTNAAKEISTNATVNAQTK